MYSRKRYTKNVLTASQIFTIILNTCPFSYISQKLYLGDQSIFYYLLEIKRIKEKINT